MGRSLQDRFYIIMENYMDDCRIAAHSITFFTQEKTSVEEIYRDLLGGKFKKWVWKLEKIIKKEKNISEWQEDMLFKLDMMNSNIWSIGDILAIERGAWKYGI